MNFKVSPIANILISFLLLTAFFEAGTNIVQTFPVANMAALNNLAPQPMDYFWQLNMNGAAVDKNKIRYYADYYEHLLQVFPGLRDVYGLLGYSYHYLNNDPKAIDYLNKAIAYDPDYFWNYYNLGVIYINESRYKQAADVLQKGMKIEPMVSFKRLFTSQMVYLPLLKVDDKKTVIVLAQHLKETYQSSLVIIKLLTNSLYANQMPDLMKRINPELYAF